MFWILYIISRARGRHRWEVAARREMAALRADVRAGTGLPPLPDPSIARRLADEQARRVFLRWLRRGVILLVVFAVLCVVAFAAAVVVYSIQHGAIHWAHTPHH